MSLVAAAIVVIVFAGVSARLLAAEEAPTLKGVALVIGETKYKHLAPLTKIPPMTRERSRSFSIVWASTPAI